MCGRRREDTLVSIKDTGLIHLLFCFPLKTRLGGQRQEALLRLRAGMPRHGKTLRSLLAPTVPTFRVLLRYTAFGLCFEGVWGHGDSEEAVLGDESSRLIATNYGGAVRRKGAHARSKDHPTIVGSPGLAHRTAARSVIGTSVYAL